LLRCFFLTNDINLTQPLDAGLNLLIASDFSNSVISNNIDNGTTWRSFITNFKPDERLPQYFNYAVNSDKVFSDYLETSIANGELTQTVKQHDIDSGSTLSRNQFNWFPTFFKEVVIDAEIWIDDVYASAGNWRQLMEFRNDDGLRTEIMLARDAVVGWNVLTNSYDGGGIFINEAARPDILIPVNQWFKISVRYKLGVTDGALEVGIEVNGVKTNLFNMNNIQTSQIGGNINFINYSKVYGATFPATQKMKFVRIYKR